MKRRYIPFLLLFLVAVPATACADMALVPQSGQTLCYDAAGAEIPCAGTGQDGDQQMGIPWPSPRFTDNNNGTVTDNLTGLIWLKKANCFSSYYWTQALTSANTLASGACGLTDGSVAGDWRLPNRNELVSVFRNRQQSDPAAWLNTVGFSGVQYNNYWSSSSAAANPTVSAWVVQYSGTTSYREKNGYNTTYVWPVRGGQ